MVNEYLEKTKEGFVAQRALLKEQIHSYENRVKENIQFIQVLEDASDTNYDAFTPRQVNSFNRRKIVELQEEQKALSEQVTELRSQLGDIDYRIDEISSVMKVAREDTSDTPDHFDEDMKMTILQTVETERQRIARDLHDSTTQSLTSLVHKTELCTKLLDVDPVRCKLELYSIGKTLRDIIEETRKIIYDLRPMSFDDIGFDVTVERSLDKFKRLNNIKCNYYVQGKPFAVNSVVQITLLRVIQEACSNAMEHAEASRLDVYLIYEENRLVLRVVDDGKGFDVDAVSDSLRADNSGFGISMMKERVYLLSGKLEVRSTPGEGCTIEVVIPNAGEE